MLQRISFWLIPTIKTRSIFQQIIDQLAERYDAPTFTPHVTLYFGNFASEVSLPDLMQQATQPIKKLELEVDRLRYTDQFTKTLFIQFQSHSVLSQLTEALQHSAIEASGFSLNPHLSLIYHPLNQAEQQRIVSEINLPQSKVEFDQIWATSTSATVQSREDVESWQVLHTVDLASNLAS